MSLRCTVPCTNNYSLPCKLRLRNWLHFAVREPPAAAFRFSMPPAREDTHINPFHSRAAAPKPFHGVMHARGEELSRPHTHSRARPRALERVRRDWGAGYLNTPQNVPERHTPGGGAAGLGRLLGRATADCPSQSPALLVRLSHQWR